MLKIIIIVATPMEMDMLMFILTVTPTLKATENQSSSHHRNILCKLWTPTVSPSNSSRCTKASPEEAIRNREANRLLIMWCQGWSSLFQIKLFRKLWDQSQFPNLISKCLRFKMNYRERWLRKSNVLCASSSHMTHRSAKNAINSSVNIVSSNWSREETQPSLRLMNSMD